MTIRVGINGFGRIGRGFWKAVNTTGIDRGIEIVAANDLGDVATMAHLLKYDSTAGDLKEAVTVRRRHDPRRRQVDQDPRRTRPGQPPLGRPGRRRGGRVDRHLHHRPQAKAHIAGGAKKVIEEQYDPKAHAIISAGSCTTNCVVLAVKVLHDAFNVERGFMSTIHSYTGDQNLVDGTHKDLRRARAAALNIVPTSSGASEAVGRIIPALAGKFDGVAFRVPTPTVSLLDLVTTLRDTPSTGAINEAFMAAASGPLKSYLHYEKDELVSMDFKGHPASAIHDAQSTMVLDGGIGEDRLVVRQRVGLLLKERRTDADGEAIFAEALQRLRSSVELRRRPVATGQLSWHGAQDSRAA